MGVTEDLADRLAREAIEASQTLGDEGLIDEVARVVGATSTTTQEAFMTAVRVRLAAARGHRLVEERLRKAGKAAAQGGPDRAAAADPD